MNERIRQLLNEATVGLEPDLSTHTTITHNELSKFAELIVKECVDIVAYGGEFASRTSLVEKLQNHFGVKE